MKLTVLVSPLNWGLGHATRCVPIIRLLLAKDCRVIICGSGNSLIMLKAEFPQLEYEVIAEYNIKYSKNKSLFALKLLFQLPLFYIGKIKETVFLKKIVAKYSPDIIISDNRYGFYNKNAYSVLITHQIKPMLPAGFKWLQPLFWRILSFWLKPFDEIWIPDYSDNGLAGKLSETIKNSKYKYCGLLSRFKGLEVIDENYRADVLIILSGPEPQRTIFEKLCRQSLPIGNKKVVMVLGSPNNKTNEINSTNYNVFSHLPTEELSKFISNASLIISRSGYSSIMDYLVLGKKAILVPTPGQTEQEYLAEYHFKRGNFLFIPQNKFNLIEAIRRAEENMSIKPTSKYNLIIESIVDDLLLGLL